MQTQLADNLDNIKGLILGEYSLSRKILKFLLCSAGLKNTDEMDCDCFFSNSSDCLPYTFVVFDVGIGDRDSLSCLKLIRDKVPNHIPIIAFINHIDGDIFTKVIKAGATLCLSKILGADVIEKEFKGLLQARC